MVESSPPDVFSRAKQPHDSAPLDVTRLIHLAAFICQTPMAALTLVDGERYWVDSAIALPSAAEATILALGARTLSSSTSIFLSSLADDSDLTCESLVTASVVIQFYAGIPLVLRDGTPVGVLSVMDTKQRQLDETVTDHLMALAQQVILNLELRRQPTLPYSCQQFRLFVNTMPIIVWTAEPDGRIDYGNNLFSDFVGVDFQSLVEDQAWARSLHPDDLAPTLKIWNDAIASGRMYLTEFRLRRHDGTYRWHLARAVPIRVDDDKDIIKWVGTAIDIHDRNVSDANTQRLAERLGATLENITDAFMTVDRNWAFTHINKEAERLIGRSLKDLKGKNLWQEFPETIGGPFEHNYRLAMNEGGKVSFEALFSPLDSWFSVNAYPSRDGLAIYFQNTNALRQSQEQLKLLETCVAHMNDIVIISEAESQDRTDSRILFVNNAFVHRTGYSRKEVLGKPRHILHGPKTQADTLQRIRNAMQNSQPIREELINYTKDGEEFWLDVDYVPVTDSLNTITHWVAVKRDITERKNAEREHTRIIELEQAQQLAELANQTKSRFLATMSHEIRTPISGVIGMVEVLQKTCLNDYQLDLVDTISDSALSLLDIIDDILDFSKIEAGKLDLESAPVNLFALLKSVYSLLKHFAANKGVELTFFCDPAIQETVLGDTVRLRQVLLNLVNNAIKFSSGMNYSGRVNVRMQLQAATANTVIIDFLIADNGIGMDKQTLERLFTPFVQADASTTRHFGGTGLGLTISRSLVRLMGGEISVDSEPDIGSTFCIRLEFERVPDSLLDKPSLPDFSGLQCNVLLGDEIFADDIITYLNAADIAVERMLEPIRIADVTPSITHDQCVWILDTAHANFWPADLPLAVQHNMRRVILVSGLQHGLRIIGPHCVEVASDLLDRHTLYQAIAIAAGREQQEMLTIETDTEAAAFNYSERQLSLTQEKNILVAEDNKTNQKVIVHQLALLGYAADVVNDGYEALARLQTHRYSLLLTDLHMPEMDGYELVTSIRARDTQDYLPIIALSANALHGEAERCRALGIDCYLTKPTSLAELQRALGRWLPRAENRSAMAVSTKADQASIEPMKLSVLKDLVGDEAGVVDDFLEAFRQDILVQAKDFHAAMASDNLTELAQLAHKLKSSARSVGAQKLGTVCAELESLAKKGELSAVKALLVMFEQELLNVHEYLARR